MENSLLFDCQKWLDELTLDNIPKRKNWQRSLMDITGIKHHENMWSDIYSFFFSVNEEHNMKDLFIRSLENVLRKDKQNHLIEIGFLNDFKVEREYVVNGQQRIDLLLKDDISHRAIIIENKVYHALENNLGNYYESIKKEGFRDVIVIVLGLTKYRINPDYYSITHLGLLDEVLKNLPQYMPNANPKYIYLLQEFYKNIKNHTNMIDPKELAFFCKNGNQEKIVKIHDIYNHIIKYLIEVMEAGKDSPLKNQIEALNLKPKSERDYVKYIFNDKRAKENMMLTVFYKNNILRPKDGRFPHIHVVLEIQGKIKQIVEENYEHYMSILRLYQDIQPNEAKASGWWHFASLIIPLADLENDLPKLADIVSMKINKDCSLLRLGYAILDEIQKEQLVCPQTS